MTFSFLRNFFLGRGLCPESRLTWCNVFPQTPSVEAEIDCTLQPRSRRSFLKGSAVLGCGLGAAGFSSLSIAGAVVGAADERLNIIGPRKGFSPQIGTLVSMFNLDAQRNSGASARPHRDA